MTKKEMFTTIATLLADHDDIVEFCNHEVELLSKKRSDNTKKKAESDARAQKLYDALAEMDKPVSIAELKELTNDEEVAGWTSQRISALFRSLGEDKVIKTFDKKGGEVQHCLITKGFGGLTLRNRPLFLLLV